MLRENGLSTVTKLQGGRNNGVFLGAAKGRKLVLKQFTKSNNSADRYIRESEFLRFANAIEHTAAPELLDTCPNHQTVLTSFVTGDQIKLFAMPDLEQTLSFLKQINSVSHREFQPPSHNAIEAVFDFKDFSDSLNWRLNSIERLLDRNLDLEIDLMSQSIATYVESTMYRQDLLNLQDLIEATFLTALGQKFISPSDLGSHNVLGDSGRLTFIDFEYSGMDSGINLLGDFLTQPDTVIDRQDALEFSKKFLSSIFRLEKVRLESVLRLHSVRWLALMLRRSLAKDMDISTRLTPESLGRYFALVVEPNLQVRGDRHGT